MDNSRVTHVGNVAKRIRAHVLNMTYRAKSSHVGSSLSITDIMAVLYQDILKVDIKDSAWPDRDRFILSKGHGCAALYAALSIKGFFPEDWLNNFCQNGSSLAGHVTHKGVPG